MLDEVYTSIQAMDPNEQDVILLGDFNLPPDDQGFSQLSRLLTPLITGARHTTISENAKSLYDNIWLDPEYVREYSGRHGVDDFDVTVFNNDDRAASLAVSDHRPVWAIFETSNADDDGDATEVLPQSWGAFKRNRGK